MKDTRTVIYTIDSRNTSNARQVAENQHGRTYTNIKEFTDTLLQYDLIKDDSEVVFYEVWEWVAEFNHATIFDDSLNVENAIMGYINVNN